MILIKDELRNMDCAVNASRNPVDRDYLIHTFTFIPIRPIQLIGLNPVDRDYFYSDAFAKNLGDYAVQRLPNNYYPATS